MRNSSIVLILAAGIVFLSAGAASAGLSEGAKWLFGFSEHNSDNPFANFYGGYKALTEDEAESFDAQSELDACSSQLGSGFCRCMNSHLPGGITSWRRAMNTGGAALRDFREQNSATMSRCLRANQR